jgi:lysophospholipase L1-like esterase
MKFVPILIFVAILVYSAYEALRIYGLLQAAKQTQLRVPVPFTSEKGARTMLVLGDSTAVGVGTESEHSVPAKVSRLIDASVENYAKSGAVVADLEAQLSRANKPRYDLILIQAGANDVIHFRSLSAAQSQMSTLLEKVSKHSDKIILLTAGKIGDAPIFPMVLRPLLTSRAGNLRQRFLQISEERGVKYVDLYTISEQFHSDPSRFYAKDMLHLSADGYDLWYQEVEKVVETNWPELVHAK